MSDYEVHTARTMDEAMQLAQAHKFDLYIFDKWLPDGSGLELCEKLNRLTPGVPCIFYSGDAYEIHRRQAMAAGADAYIPKPDIDALIDAAHTLLSERECSMP
jgi:DNA-binding response OmpR family regulator